LKNDNLNVKPLPDSRYEVSFDVQNTGSRAGADVAQVYVGGPKGVVARPAKEVKGLSKVDLSPGQTKRIAMMLDSRTFYKLRHHGDAVANPSWRLRRTSGPFVSGDQTAR
jgi:hypothetical protein